MGKHRYKAWNGPMPTTAAQLAVATGTTVKTLLQIAAPATRQLEIISWGVSYSEAAGAVGTVELLETDVAATVTAHVAAGVQPLDPGSPASLVTLGTSATGYTATVEGAITAVREFDAARIPASLTASPAQHRYQFMPNEKPVIAVSRFLRIRITTPTTGVNALAWVVWEE